MGRETLLLVVVAAAVLAAVICLLVSELVALAVSEDASPSEHGPRHSPDGGPRAGRHHGFNLLPLLLVTTGPDTDAFIAGFRLVFGLALGLIALLAGLSLIRRILGS